VTVPEWARGTWHNAFPGEEESGIQVWIKNVEITDSRLVLQEAPAAQFTAAAVIGDTVRFDGPANESIYIIKQPTSIYFSGLKYNFRMCKSLDIVPDWAQGMWGGNVRDEDSGLYNKWADIWEVTETTATYILGDEHRQYRITAVSGDGDTLYFTDGTYCTAFRRWGEECTMGTSGYLQKKPSEGTD
jgi:hypothetical protein